MTDRSQAPTRDALATLVTRCRELREFVDSLTESNDDLGSDSFLEEQLDDVWLELMESLDRLREGGGKQDSEDEEGAGERSGRAPALEGSAWTIPIADFVGFLATHRKTGVLWVTSPDELFLVELRDGMLSRASSDQAPPGQRLGDVLVAQGALDEEEVGELVEEARRDFKHLGSYLVESGAVTEEQVRRALTAQVQAIFSRLMKSENAVYRFQEGSELTDAHHLGINVTGLMLESARLIDESELDLDILSD